MQLIDNSYIYLGWVLDLIDTDDPLEDISALAALLQSNITGDGSAQVVQAMLQVAPFILGNDYFGGEEKADSDLNVGAGLGNGGGVVGTGPDTVYRLREGIERFLITDINNPAGSAQAQSEVFVMADTIAVSTSAFNHIPGGSNVLYMDGHVSFERYEELGDGPVNGSVARTIGLVLEAAAL